MTEHDLSFWERLFTPGGAVTGPGGWLGRTMESMWGIDRPDPSILTQRTRAIMQTPQFAEQEARRRTIPSGLPAHLIPSAAPKPGAPGGPAITGVPKPAVRWKTVSEGGWDYQVGLDREGKEVSREALGRTQLPAGEAKAPPRISEAQRRQAELAESEAERRQGQQIWERLFTERETTREREEAERRRFQEQQQFQFQQEQQAATEQWRGQQLQQQMQMQEQQLGWQREQAQMQQAESERRERARLSANPISWLQFASFTGETPVIQPWMKPLMSQQNPELQIGQAIPGWTEQGGTAMPQLTTPGAQLWSRMGPTAQAGFLGFQQSQQGIRPEEQMFRLGAQAAPGGRTGGWSWLR